jgi:hypothetical protein
MDGKDAAHSPNSAPIYRPSAEITPAEYEYYMRKAQQMRAESAAEFFRMLARAVRRIFVRARPAPQREAPIFAKSRTA